MADKQWDGLDPDDDLIAMERSTMQTFIGPEQRGVLIEMWARQEQADHQAFLREHAPDMADPYFEEPETEEDEDVGS